MAKTYLVQLEECLGLARDKGVRIVVNAGGLNPAGLAQAVRALAAAICGDDVLPIADAAEVWAVEGSSYLDRTIADIAAAAAEVRTGDVLGAEQRLSRLAELVRSVGDHTASNLVAHVQAALLPFGSDGVKVNPGEIRPGWRRVVAGLQGVAAVPAG